MLNFEEDFLWFAKVCWFVVCLLWEKNPECLTLTRTLKRQGNYHPWNIFAPENHWLEDWFPFGKAYFRRRTLSFREGTSFHYKPWCSKHQPDLHLLTTPVQKKQQTCVLYFWRAALESSIFSFSRLVLEKTWNEIQCLLTEVLIQASTHPGSPSWLFFEWSLFPQRPVFYRVVFCSSSPNNKKGVNMNRKLETISKLQLKSNSVAFFWIPSWHSGISGVELGDSQIWIKSIFGGSFPY